MSSIPVIQAEFLALLLQYSVSHVPDLGFKNIIINVKKTVAA